jgi:autotransporter-associated beta strand protein
VLNLGLDLIYGGTVTLHDGSISGSHSLTSLTHDFELRNGTVSANLAGSVGVRKAADSYTVGSVTSVVPGTVVLASSNAFTGAVAVEAGVLKVTDDGALGNLSSATYVSTGATLEFGRPTSLTGISVAEQVTITGAGYGSNGALRNTSGANFLTSQLTLASDAKIQVEAGSSLTMNGGVSAQNKTLTANVITTVISSVTHAGTLSLDGFVSMAGGKIIKIGAGTLNLNSGTDFDGASADNIGLDVQVGTVRANHIAALGVGRVQVGTASAGATFARFQNAAAPTSCQRWRSVPYESDALSFVGAVFSTNR